MTLQELVDQTQEAIRHIEELAEAMKPHAIEAEERARLKKWRQTIRRFHAQATIIGREQSGVVIQGGGDK